MQSKGNSRGGSRAQGGRKQPKHLHVPCQPSNCTNKYKQTPKVCMFFFQLRVLQLQYLSGRGTACNSRMDRIYHKKRYILEPGPSWEPPQHLLPCPSSPEIWHKNQGKSLNVKTIKHNNDHNEKLWKQRTATGIQEQCTSRAHTQPRGEILVLGKLETWIKRTRDVESSRQNT